MIANENNMLVPKQLRREIKSIQINRIKSKILFSDLLLCYVRFIQLEK